MLEEKTIDSTEKYKGKVFDITFDNVELSNGYKTIREVVHHKGGVVIAAEKDGKILMVKQYRYPTKEVLYELPAGKLDKQGETVDEAAKRELEEKTENLAKQSITPNEIALALKMKINTLDSNLVYPTATKNMRMTLVDYLRYIKENNITDDKQELKSIIKLICIDNDLTKSNENQEISLFNLKLPEEIKSLYNIGESKKGRFLFIYNNPEFKSLKNEGITEQKLLENLINENRLDIRIQR